jgi:phage tail protein X
MRYRSNQLKKSIDGRTVYRSRIYPNIPLSSTDVYVMSETGDRLDTLASQYYGDSSLWWIIACANNIHNAHLGLADGTILRIPQNYRQIISNFNT